MGFQLVPKSVTSVIYFSKVNEYENENDWYAITKTKTRLMLSYETKII